MAFTIRIPPSKENLQDLKEKFPDADPTAVDLTVRFMICSSRLEDFMTCHFAEHDLTQARFSALMVLYKSPDRRAKPIEMANTLGVTRGNMTGVLDNLQRDGWITRENDPQDRRVNYVRLTDKGLKKLNKMLPAHFERIRHLAHSLGRSEREVFLTCLEKLQASLQKMRKGS